MARFSFGFSQASINRLFSSYSAAQKEKERLYLIASQEGIKKDMPPIYSIKKFDFDKELRTCRIDFEEVKKYRTIDRYVTQDGIRYPIYSDWKSKSKTIRKTLKLTNEELERLNKNEDELIASKSFEIVERIGIEDLYPSWFIIAVLENERDEKIYNLEYENNKKIKEHKRVIADLDNERKKEDINIRSIQQSITNSKINISKISEKILNLENKKRCVFLTIITFGIYALFCNKKRLESLQYKLSSEQIRLKNYEISVKEKDERINEIGEKILKLQGKIDDINEKQKQSTTKIFAKYEAIINTVEPLMTDIEEKDDTFVPLKVLAGLKYRKIIGCYVIHNTLNDKYYVGQSKDVIKRVCKQHFNGTKIVNISFAQDYYETAPEKRDDMFEVKIIELQTKDELDRKEKELIDLYDSYNNGYNSTRGND